MVAPDEKERRCGGPSCNGMVRRVANQAALDVGLLAFRMAQGHYVHSAALAVAAHPDAGTLSPALQPGSPMPVAQVKRSDGSAGLTKFPAHNQLARVRGKIPLEITPNLDGCEVLFSFAGPADFLDLLTSAEFYLKAMGLGDPLRG
jgi:hypothetical protein